MRSSTPRMEADGYEGRSGASLGWIAGVSAVGDASTGAVATGAAGGAGVGGAAMGGGALGIGNATGIAGPTGGGVEERRADKRSSMSDVPGPRFLDGRGRGAPPGDEKARGGTAEKGGGGGGLGGGGGEGRPGGLGCDRCGAPPARSGDPAPLPAPGGRSPAVLTTLGRHAPPSTPARV